MARGEPTNILYVQLTAVTIITIILIDNYRKDFFVRFRPCKIAQTCCQYIKFIMENYKYISLDITYISFSIHNLINVIPL